MIRFNVPTVILLIVCFWSYSQDTSIEWSPDYELKLEDFQNPGTEINQDNNNVLIQSGVTIELAFQMNGVAFMFKKNFNDKVICKFRKDAALIIAPDTLNVPRLLSLAQFDFDLSELYARKIRKEIYENKKVVSNSNFFEPYFNSMISERNEISSKVYKDSDFGNKGEIVRKEHETVLKEIEELADFCSSCKPPKKSRKSKQK